jgi:NAD(P)-dependent dehydrogenase (short-subunit alcohol dehydrogenase family)
LQPLRKDLNTRRFTINEEFKDKGKRGGKKQNLVMTAELSNVVQTYSKESGSRRSSSTGGTMASDETGHIALVTGANRGIGFEVCRQLASAGLIVLLTARDARKAKAAADALRSAGRVEPLVMDVDDANSIANAAVEVANQYERLDVLINNAGINYDTWETVENADINRTVMETITTNLLGPWRVCQAFLPLLRKSRAGRLVNVSSESGSLAHMGAGPPAYQVTKAALNALTRTLAGELRGSRILVNSVCPGWVATDMGGKGGRPVAEGAAGIVWAATLPDDGPTGGFFQDRKPLPW